MNIRNLLSPRHWQNFIYESIWKLQEPPPLQVPLSWQPPTTWLAETTIYWPTTYNWGPCAQWGEPIATGISQLLPLKRVPIQQPYEGLILIEVNSTGKKFPIAIDYSDYIETNKECAAQVSLYFKMQYTKDGYALKNIIPGGYVPNSSDAYYYIPHLRKLADNTTKKYEVYGRFNINTAPKIRGHATKILSSQQRFAFEGDIKRIRYSGFLQEAAEAAICINLPGNGDLCFRLLDYFSVGACVVSPQPQTILHVPLTNKEQIVFCKQDFSDLVPLCEHYLAHDKERASLTHNSRNFFDKYLHYKQLSAYYLDSICNRLF